MSPGILGVGIGGTPEKAMLLAKESLMEPLNMHELKANGADDHLQELRLELFDKVNALGIGAQGLGGLTTVLDVKVKDYPTHAANKPVAVIPNCSATRHVHFTLDGSGPAEFTAPDLNEWPDIKFELGSDVKRVNLDTLTQEELRSWQSGDTLLLSGKMLTGRDAAHKKLIDMLDKGEPLPVDFTNRLIYYVGPVDPVRDEVVGPAGPTTATRMDKFTRRMLEETGLAGMIGKAERGAVAIDAIRDNQAVSMIAVGGAAFLVAKAIKKSTLLAFPELGMEAIYEFEVEDMPVTVSVDSHGNSVHIEGPKIWSQKIAIKSRSTRFNKNSFYSRKSSNLVWKVRQKVLKPSCCYFSIVARRWLWWRRGWGSTSAALPVAIDLKISKSETYQNDSVELTWSSSRVEALLGLR